MIEGDGALPPADTIHMLYARVRLCVALCVGACLSESQWMWNYLLRRDQRIEMERSPKHASKRDEPTTPWARRPTATSSRALRLRSPKRSPRAAHKRSRGRLRVPRYANKSARPHQPRSCRERAQALVQDGEELLQCGRCVCVSPRRCSCCTKDDHSSLMVITLRIPK